MRQVDQIRVDFIDSLPGRRPINPDAVDRLAASIKSIGLRTPITVRMVDDYVDSSGEIIDGQPILVTGAHRLEAVKRLGWKEIECFLFTDSSEYGDDEITAKLWEISENLHRAELTTLERSEQIAEWVRLTEERGKLVQVEPVSERGRVEGRGNQGGVRAASRELGIERSKVVRAVKIASIPEEAKEAAAAAGLADNQSALERVARADDAVAEVGRIVDEREQRKTNPTPRPTNHAEPASLQNLVDEAARCGAVEEGWSDEDEAAYAGILDAWETATPAARQRFLRVDAA